MILLPSNTHDFKTLANKVVDEHVGTGKSIEDCIVEISERHEFTPEEIKRLVEKSNTELALRHLRGDNKKENFALAKYDNVLKRTHGVAEVNDDDEREDDGDEDLEKTSEYHRHTGTSVLPYTRRNPPDSVRFNRFEKTAMLGRAKDRRELNSGQYYALFDDYEKAKFEKAAAEFRIQENFDWLVRNVSRLKDEELTKFASDVACAHRGRKPQVMLKHIGIAAGKGDLNKYATESITYTDDSDEAIRRLSSIYSDIERFEKKAEEVRMHEAVLTASNEAIKRLACR